MKKRGLRINLLEYTDFSDRKMSEDRKKLVKKTRKGSSEKSSRKQ